MTTITPIRPMEPILSKEAIDNAAWTAQVKWDGVRCLTYLKDGSCWLFNRKLHERTLQYPELQSLLKLCKSTTAVLDGEIISLIDGKPSFSAVLRRDWATNPANIKAAVKRQPVCYMIFDILHGNGRDLTTFSFEERQELLTKQIIQTEGIRLVENFPGMGGRLFQAVAAQNLEGVVLKKSDSPYIPGKKSAYWHKVKAMRQTVCQIAGYTFNNAGIRSLLLAVPQGDDLVYAGRASIGLTEAGLRTAGEVLAAYPAVKSPVKKTPRLPGIQLQWVAPIFTAEIEFLEWTDDLQLRHPKILRLNLS